MSTMSELIQEGKLHRISLKNRNGKTLISISLLWAVILVIAAPQLLLVVLISLALDLVDIEYDGQELGLAREG